MSEIQNTSQLYNKVFKNASLIDLNLGLVNLVDIFCVGGKIEKIVKSGAKIFYDAEIVDLNGDYVLPMFVNAYCDSVEAFKNSYGRQLQEINEIKLAQKLMYVKNILAGTTLVDDVSLMKEKWEVLKNVEQLSELQLSEISDYVAKNNKGIFLDVGRSLEELGTIDKMYRKPLSYVLEDFGFFDRDFALVGANCFDKDDFQVVENYCGRCVLTPMEDGLVGRRHSNVVSLKNYNFDIAIGSGGAFEIDFFAYMRQMLLSHRAMFEDANILSEQEVLQMAFNPNINGYINDITEGNYANFMVVHKIESLYDNVYKELVWGKSKKDVVMTVAEGEILQKNGEIIMQNYPKYYKIIEELQEITRRN